MLNYTIDVRSTLRENRLMNYCTRFFKLSFKSEYLMVQLKLKDSNGKTYKVVPLRAISLNDKNDIILFKSKTMVQFYEKFRLNENITIKKAIFEYKEIGRFAYIRDRYHPNTTVFDDEK